MVSARVLIAVAQAKSLPFAPTDIGQFTLSRATDRQDDIEKFRRVGSIGRW